MTLIVEGLTRQEFKSAVRNGRNHRLYFKWFDLGDTQGKRVLDIGAGDADFSAVTGSVALDADYCDIKPAHKQTSVTAVGQHLPFRNNCFDVTIASHCIIWVRHGLREMLSEMLRVTRDGGSAQIYPTCLNDDGLDSTLPDDAELLFRPDENDQPAYTLVITKKSQTESERNMLLSEVLRLIRISLHSPIPRDETSLASAIRQFLY